MKTFDKTHSHYKTFIFCTIGFLMNVALGGIMMAVGKHEESIKCFCGAIVWAICMFIFDHLAKRR